MVGTETGGHRAVRALHLTLFLLPRSLFLPDLRVGAIAPIATV